jgi:hypothetical protein
MKEWQHIIIEKTNKANLYDQLLQAQGDELVETLGRQSNPVTIP